MGRRFCDVEWSSFALVAGLLLVPAPALANNGIEFINQGAKGAGRGGARTPAVSFPAIAYLKLEISVSLQVMNSSKAGTPASVCSIPRLIAGMISSGSVIRSP